MNCFDDSEEIGVMNTREASCCRKLACLLSHAGRFPVNRNQGKLAQSVIFQGLAGARRPVFPFRDDAGGAAASARFGAWHLCRAYELRPAGCERGASKNVRIPEHNVRILLR